MSVHYKFKSTLNFDTITFDGLHISVADLKREIVQQKRLGKIIDFDLQITNAQTKEEYKDDNFLIPKNTTLIISRIPIAHPVKKGWDPPAENAVSNAPSAKADNINMDLFKMQGSEEDKIQAMMMQSTADYDPKTYHRIKGQSQVGEVPANYRCNKCKRGGHWIKNCSFSSGKDQFEVKRNTGIPRSFRGKPDISNEQETSNYIAPTEKDQEIPEDLICGICRNIFVDAVMIPCCGSSFCDDCVRSSLLESEDSECPDCKEKNCSPGSLIPNRFLRNSVNVFKNESGYKLGAFKPGKSKTPKTPTPITRAGRSSTITMESLWKEIDKIKENLPGIDENLKSAINERGEPRLNLGDPIYKKPESSLIKEAASNLSHLQIAPSSVNPDMLDTEFGSVGWVDTLNLEQDLEKRDIYNPSHVLQIVQNVIDQVNTLLGSKSFSVDGPITGLKVTQLIPTIMIAKEDSAGSGNRTIAPEAQGNPDIRIIQQVVNHVAEPNNSMSCGYTRVRQSLIAHDFTIKKKRSCNQTYRICEENVDFSVDVFSKIFNKYGLLPQNAFKLVKLILTELSKWNMMARVFDFSPLKSIEL